MDGVSVTKRRLVYKNTDDDYAIFQGTNKTGSAADSSVHIFLVEFDTTDKLYEDGGTADISDNAGTEDHSGLMVGTNWDASGSFLNGKIKEIVYNDGAMSAKDKNNIGAELALQHGGSWSAV
jgi:hypothetical protein